MPMIAARIDRRGRFQPGLADGICIAPTRRRLSSRGSHLTSDEQPAPLFLGVDLLSGEKVGVVRQELLQEALGVVGRLLHCDQRFACLRTAIRKSAPALSFWSTEGILEDIGGSRRCPK
jgi:hypothetical protein